MPKLPTNPKLARYEQHGTAKAELNVDSRTEQLRARTKDFALRIIDLFRALPDTKEAHIIGNQLLRCGTAVEAKYRSARHARSRADFTEEADETVFWLELALKLESIVKRDRLEGRLQECRELRLSPGSKTAK